MKETFSRKMYIWIAHLSWFAIYVLFLIIFDPRYWGFQTFLFIWAGCLLSLVLSAGIFGNDIASGRICVLMTKPFWPGELYIYRLLGLSLQAAAHLMLAGCVLIIIHRFTGIGNLDNLGLWLFSSWLLFNTWAAVSTSLSVVVSRAYNCLFLFIAIITIQILVSILSYDHSGETETQVMKALVKYATPPFEILAKLSKGEYGEDSLVVGKYNLIKGIACTVHCFMLTLFYSTIGIIVLSKRQFSSGNS
jgi:ABC-type transport system involved in multi-copper enzyme maturation permease subunit